MSPFFFFGFDLGFVDAGHGGGGLARVLLPEMFFDLDVFGRFFIQEEAAGGFLEGGAKASLGVQGVGGLDVGAGVGLDLRPVWLQLVGVVAFA